MRWLRMFAACAILAGGLSLSRAILAQAGCKAVTEAKKLPPLATLLDPTGLTTGLPAADSNGAREWVLSVTTGATPRAFVMDSVAAQSPIADSLVKRVIASLKPDARNAVPAFRVRVVTGEAASVYIEPSVLCGPKPQGPAPRPASFTTVTPGRGSPPPRPRSITPRLKIGVNGEVLQVDLGGGTGYPQGDRALTQSLEGQRFEPALLDGRPVQVWMRGRDVEIVR